MERCKCVFTLHRPNLKAYYLHLINHDIPNFSLGHFFISSHTFSIVICSFFLLLCSDHFLPELDPDVLNGGRVQLVVRNVFKIIEKCYRRAVHNK